MSRVKTIKPPCGYSVDGIANIWLLDYDDFSGFRFDGDETYANCLVTDILRTGDFTELDAPDMVAKYNGAGNYVHTLETFINTMNATTISNLHLGTKRRQVVIFRANNGIYYTFGYDAGAALTYVNQTGDGLGHLVTLTSPSRYPLFEVTPDALARFVSPGDYLPAHYDTINDYK